MMYATGSMAVGRQPRGSRAPSKARNLFAACLAHALHDGYTDSLYAFLPVWQAQFGLSYAGLAVVRALYYGTMGGLQMPADRWMRRVTPRAALALSTLIAGAGFLLMALPLGIASLCVGLVVAGVGSSIQHPRASQLVTDTYREAARGPLGVYSFSGDLGKAALPSVAALLVPVLAWRPVVGLMALLGLLATLSLLSLAPQVNAGTSNVGKDDIDHGSRRGFRLLSVIGGLDTATRMGYLLSLPFLIHSRGGTSATVGMGLALLFIGGALRQGDLQLVRAIASGSSRGVMATEAATAAAYRGDLVHAAGTQRWSSFRSSALCLTGHRLCSTEPFQSLHREGDTGRAFAIFYTSVIGAGGSSPHTLRHDRRSQRPDRRHSGCGRYRGTHRPACARPSAIPRPRYGRSAATLTTVLAAARTTAPSCFSGRRLEMKFDGNDNDGGSSRVEHATDSRGSAGGTQPCQRLDAGGQSDESRDLPSRFGHTKIKAGYSTPDCERGY